MKCFSRRRRTLPSRAPQRTRLLGNSVSAYATFRITTARRIRNPFTRPRLAPSARGCEQLTCASNSTVVGRDPRRFDVDIPFTKCRRTRFLGKPEFAFPSDDSSCCHECADLVTICTVASPSERSRASCIGIREATYRAEGALYLCVHHRERGCWETGCPRTQRFA